MTQFSKFNNITKKLFCYFFVLLVVICNIQNSYAIYEGVRGADYDTGSKMCDTGEIKFDPFMENKDIEWNLSNSGCATYIATLGATMMAADLAAKYIGCFPTNAIGLAKHEMEVVQEEAVPSNPFLTPDIPIKSSIKGYRCGARISEYATFQAACNPANPAGCTQASLAATDVAKCCSAVAIYTSAVGVYLGALGAIHGVASKTYDIARICGHDWNEWRKDNDGMWVKGRGQYRECINHLFLGDGTASSCDGIGNRAEHFERKISNKFYREFIYGGKEFEDNGSGACDNPWSKEERREVLGYDSGNQRYYMTGSAEAPAFVCQRFLTNEVTPETQRAFECCKKRSQNVMCIQNKPGLPNKLGDTSGGTLGNYEYKFCELGKRCEAGDVFFDIYESRVESGYLCARTYSVCPYNHNLGGGTEIEEYDTTPNAPLKVKNFCQHLNHCSKQPIMPFVRNSTLDGKFISSTCRDMKGDSQNSYSYNLKMTSTRIMGFTAPMAQCFKETMENVFLNKAGYSECLDPDEFPDRNGICKSGYKFQKGKTLNTDSFFVKIQKSLKNIIRIGLVFAVVIFGYAIFMAVPKEEVTKKKLLTFILKIGMVMYFATGTGWQDNFMNNIFGISTTLSDIVFNPDLNAEENKLDGCQFPKFNYEDDNANTRHLNPKYSPENQYLKIWDTLDCKITRALGYTQATVPNLIMMILAGFLVGGLGVIFFLATFFFAFMLLSIAVRALHIFLISTTAIILLIYISPITITMMLFEKTKNIFTNWWKQLLGFILQPMILFAYIGILINLLDATVVGDVTFKGDGISAPKQVICSGEVKDTSLYCIFNIANLDKFPGLEIIGIGLPLLTDMNKTKLQSIIKAAFIVFIYMQFMDKIAEFAKKLVGGGDLSSDWGVSGVASKAAGAMQGAVERGRRGLAKHGGSAMSAMRGEGSGAISKGGVEKVKKTGGIDSASLEASRKEDIASREDGEEGVDAVSSEKVPAIENSSAKNKGKDPVNDLEGVSGEALNPVDETEKPVEENANAEKVPAIENGSAEESGGAKPQEGSSPASDATENSESEGDNSAQEEEKPPENAERPEGVSDDATLDNSENGAENSVENSAEPESAKAESPAPTQETSENPKDEPEPKDETASPAPDAENIGGNEKPVEAEPSKGDSAEDKGGESGEARSEGASSERSGESDKEDESSSGEGSAREASEEVRPEGVSGEALNPVDETEKPVEAEPLKVDPKAEGSSGSKGKKSRSKASKNNTKSRLYDSTASSRAQETQKSDKASDSLKSGTGGGGGAIGRATGEKAEVGARGTTPNIKGATSTIDTGRKNK